jgi:hypothetical protein
MRAAHELFAARLAGATPPAAAALRPLVAESWMRSIATGVNPEFDGAPTANRTLALRTEHPLAPALPVIRRLLVDEAMGTGAVVAVSAADGTLLWVEGDHGARHKAEAMNFSPGADWSERSAGTNAPGTALALDRELQISGPEHFCQVAQAWSCAAVPVHDPITGALIGAIDVTGDAHVATSTAMAWVRAAVVAIENHLAVLRLRPAPADPVNLPRLTVLGTERARWHVADEFGHVRTSTLTPRHAEILVLLSRHPEGLSTDHLAMLLDEKDLDGVTVRAEMSRLRRAIGPGFIGSRPYRLLRPIVTDLGSTFDALEAGDVHAAVDRYTGALLPQSASPSIARLRTELSTSVRSAVLASGDLSLLRRWLEHPDGGDDRDGWRLLRDRAERGSAHWAQARGHLAGIDFELG